MTTEIMNFSNLIHPAVDTTAEEIYSWMAQNYQSYLNHNGHVDAEAIAEQAAFELGVSRELAEDVAEIFASEYNRGV